MLARSTYIENYEEICMYSYVEYGAHCIVLNQPNVRLPPLVSLRKILV